MRPFATNKFYPPVMFGENVSAQIGEKLAEAQVKSVLVFYDKGVYDAGIVIPILDGIIDENICVTTYDSVFPDTPDYSVEAGRDLAISLNVDAIVGIGGGSALDTAKLVASYMEGDAPISLYYSDAGYTPRPLPVRKVMLLLVPTTAGTGSEVNNVAVVTDTSCHTKRTISGGASFMADMAIVDPCLTVSVSPYNTAIAGMDMLAHSMETMTSAMRSCYSDTVSGQSVEYIWRSLPVAYRNGEDIEARSELMIATGMALMVEKAPHLAHCIGCALSARYHLPHGHACALALPATMRYVSSDAQREIKIIAEKMQLELKPGVDIGGQVAFALEELNRTLGLRSLREMGLSWDDVVQIMPELLADEKYLSKLDTRPNEDAMLNILKNVYGETVKRI